MKKYVDAIYKARYFWIHLAIADIRTKYRRSALGILWAILFPLSLTLLLAVVMGKIFNVDIKDYAPYIFSGLVIWDYITACAIAGCSAIVNAEIYIKQYTHPLAIYSLRYTLAALINFCLAFLGLLIWIGLWRFENLNASFASVPLSILLLLFLGWPIAIITSFINTIFRDFQQMVVLVFQAVWYVSPVFIDIKIFKTSNLNFLLDYNPVYHILNLFRAPLLQGQWPELVNYLWAIISIIVLWLWAAYLIIRQEKRIIFYL